MYFDSLTRGVDCADNSKYANSAIPSVAIKDATGKYIVIKAKKLQNLMSAGSSSPICGCVTIAMYPTDEHKSKMLRTTNILRNVFARTTLLLMNVKIIRRDPIMESIPVTKVRYFIMVLSSTGKLEDGVVVLVSHTDDGVLVLVFVIHILGVIVLLSSLS